MPKLEPLTPDRMDDAQRELYELITSGPRRSAQLVADDGSLRGPFDPMLRNPTIGTSLQALGAALRFGGGLDDAIRELAILVTAAHWRSRFEWNAHLPLAVRAGLPEEALVRLWDGDASGLETQEQRDIATAVRQALDQKAVSEDLMDRLLGTHGEAGAFELLVLVGYYTTLAVVMNSLEIG